VGMYQRVLAVGATPYERLSTMYMGAFRIGRQGLKAANAGRTEDAQAKAERLSAVVRRLDMCLDFTLAPDLCRNLSRLYSHIQARLNDPAEGHSVEAFSECLKILETLWDGFQKAESNTEG
jgi:flagellin-specific chaperone FliS